jgi:hypothetical protein
MTDNDKGLLASLPLKTRKSILFRVLSPRFYSELRDRPPQLRQGTVASEKLKSKMILTIWTILGYKKAALSPGGPNHRFQMRL